MLEELYKENFIYKKKFGQNFITDINFLESLVSDIEVLATDNILEIGTGAGTLTEVLAKRVKKVISIEIDFTLKNYLSQKFCDINNVQLVFDDFMKIDAEKINDMFNGESFKLVANLPYYITTPIIFKLIEEPFSVTEINIMVQKEVGERLTAKPGTKEYGAITAKIDAIGDISIVKQVNRKMFYPMPNVDSSIIKIKLNRNKYDIQNAKLFQQVVNVAFLNRRKLYSSNLMKLGITKEAACNILNNVVNRDDIRGEVLSSEQFVKISNEITKKQ